ncbi:MAG: hypothetical protein MJ053_07195, partial [Elusimicrobiaceae bacterium]|nr:hypothetical protein [Elusimicrobiaceae bacterium]
RMVSKKKTSQAFSAFLTPKGTTNKKWAKNTKRRCGGILRPLNNNVFATGRQFLLDIPKKKTIMFVALFLGDFYANKKRVYLN